jgi:hypothetical protein
MSEDLIPAEAKLKLLFEHRPWESEPDEAEWIDKSTDYKCRIMRNKHTGTLCGYVGVPRGHKPYGMTYQELGKQHTIPVHGGLTYSGGWGEGDDYHYFGFDTAHASDFSPVLAVRMLKWMGSVDDVRGFFKEEYRTWDYVQTEVNVLVLCLQALDKEMRHVS